MANTLRLTDEFNIDRKWLYEQFLDLRKYGKHHPVMKDVKIVLDKTPEFIEYEIQLIGGNTHTGIFYFYM